MAIQLLSPLLNLAYAHEQGADRTEITNLGVAAVMRHQ
jgi:hypothetical protein